MKQEVKKLLSLVLAVIILVSLIPSKEVNAANNINAPKETTVYMTPDDLQCNYVYVNVGGNIKTQKVSGFKSSKPSVATVYSYTKHSNKSKETAVDKNAKLYNNNSSTDLEIKVKPNNFGTTIISYKIGKKTYKTKVTIKKYTNPIKSITLTGANGNKNFASACSSNTWGQVQMTAQKNAIVKITPKSGWKVKSISYSQGGKGVINYNKSLKKAYIGEINYKKYMDYGYLSVTVQDKKGTEVYLSYNLVKNISNNQ